MREPGCDDDRDVEAEQAEARELAEMRPLGEVLRDMDDARRLGALPKSRARTDEELARENADTWRALEMEKGARLLERMDAVKKSGEQTVALRKKWEAERDYLRSLALSTNDLDTSIALADENISAMRELWKSLRDEHVAHVDGFDRRCEEFMATIPFYRSRHERL